MKNWRPLFTKVLLIGFLILFCFSFSCRQQGEVAITEEEAKAIGDTYFRARSEVNLDLLDEIYTPDAVIHDCSQPEDIVGLEALKSQYRYSHRALPDFQITLDEMIVKGDRIVWTWTVTGTNTGPFHTPLGDLPPTGKEVKFTGVAIDRVVEGKIVEEWVYFNVLELLQQLGFGITPPPQPPPPSK